MLAVLIGIGVGVIYFGGLYISTQKINEVKHPSLLMMASFVIRMGIFVAVFFYLSRSGYKNILLALLGVMAVRFAMTFTVKRQTPNSIKRGD